MDDFDSINHEHTGKGIMCHHVSDGERPLLEIWHLPDGTWDFMCGENDHESVEEVGVVCADCTMRMVYERFGLPVLERARVATRESENSPWQVRIMTDSEVAECFEEN